MRKFPTVLLVTAAAVSARAYPVTYNFTGTVTQAGRYDPVVPGQQIPITITLESGYPSDGTSGSPPVSTYAGPTILRPSGSRSDLILAATFDGNPVGYYFQDLTVAANSAISFSAVSIGAPSAFQLALSGALPGELPTSAIPLTLDASRFSSGTFSVNVVSGPGDNGYSGTINVIAVPEPASWALLLGAATGLTLIRARQRPRRAISL